MKNCFKKTILFDLDGVLNTYDGKYDRNCILPIKDGAYKLIKELSENYKIIIFTTRNSLIASKWVIENGLDEYVENVTNIKEPAYLIIDDRCINFNGNYEELKNKVENFEVWYKNKLMCCHLFESYGDFVIIKEKEGEENEKIRICFSTNGSIVVNGNSYCPSNSNR